MESKYSIFTYTCQQKVNHVMSFGYIYIETFAWILMDTLPKTNIAPENGGFQ